MSISLLRDQVTTGLANIESIRGTVERMDLQLQPLLREFVTNRNIPPG